MISSQDGILEKATSAKQTQKKAIDEEAIKLALQATMMNEDGTVDLSKVEGIEGYKKENATIEKDGKTYAVLTDGSMVEGKKISNLPETVETEGASENTNIIDEEGNVFVLPKGFKMTSDASNVTQGIVIEDVTAGNITIDGITTNPTAGNQFVWIPVGDIKKKEDSELKTYKIELARYIFNSNAVIDEKLTQISPNGNLVKSSSNTEYYFVEETDGELKEDDVRANALNINNFITSAKKNHGYYIARYEAGVNDENNKNVVDGNIRPLSQAGKEVWNNITQLNAAKVSRKMYNEKETIKSDLVNSYAWDTAILFIQTFGANKKYSREVGVSTTGNISTTGNGILKTTSSIDIQCNIYDIAGNVAEWNTEKYSREDYTCTIRGGGYDITTSGTSGRSFAGKDASAPDIGFRTILYL